MMEGAKAGREAAAVQWPHSPSSQAHVPPTPALFLLPVLPVGVGKEVRFTITAFLFFSSLPGQSPGFQHHRYQFVGVICNDL